MSKNIRFVMSIGYGSQGADLPFRGMVVETARQRGILEPFSGGGWWLLCGIFSAEQSIGKAPTGRVCATGAWAIFALVVSAIRFIFEKNV